MSAIDTLHARRDECLRATRRADDLSRRQTTAWDAAGRPPLAPEHVDMLRLVGMGLRRLRRLDRRLGIELGLHAASIGALGKRMRRGRRANDGPPARWTDDRDET